MDREEQVQELARLVTQLGVATVDRWSKDPAEHTVLPRWVLESKWNRMHELAELLQGSPASQPDRDSQRCSSGKTREGT